eukprot:TRINITY_DN8611_c0_g1_i4.p1 TRINITY_DN8611_c0_g1~~TRINITY_DN8611_c0_g1_i4.p1  ORF type:complete len:116 (-),score=8.61 TRINITY_DN8611_c0_g1_i4:255-602(-)
MKMWKRYHRGGKQKEGRNKKDDKGDTNTSTLFPLKPEAKGSTPQGKYYPQRAFLPQVQHATKFCHFDSWAHRHTDIFDSSDTNLSPPSSIYRHATQLILSTNPQVCNFGVLLISP